MSAAKGPMPVSLSEVKAFLRVDDSREDAVLAGLVRTASELCASFTGQALIIGERTMEIGVSRDWRRLAPTPVRRLIAVSGVDAAGAEIALPNEAVELQIDFCGDGWVRVVDAGAAVRLVLTVEAGLAADWNALPEALRQGIVRLVAHLYTHRDAADDAGPPAAIAALWRPWRRLRLS
ncbi:MAG: phage head-tail connector protein [Pseudomonadota bacterium]